MYYTSNPSLGTGAWSSQQVDRSILTTVSGLTPLTVYTVRVQAYTSVGPGPLSAPVQVKTQHGGRSWPVLASVRGRLLSKQFASRGTTKGIWQVK